MVGDKIRKLRTGEPVHKLVTIGNGNNSVDFYVVILNIDATQSIEEQVQEYCTNNADKVNDVVKSQYYNSLLAFHCLRDTGDPTYKTPVFSSVDELRQTLDIEDISRVCNAYGELMMNKAPKLELLSQEQLDLLKKHLEVTPLSDLSTVLLVHLANCHQTIVSEI